MDEKEQLLPCPFCGGDEILIEENDAYLTTINHDCIGGDKRTNAQFLISGITKQEAINKWNTRAISADEKEQLRRLKVFVNELFNTASGECDGKTIDLLFDRKLIKEHRNWYKLADWLKDENI